MSSTTTSASAPSGTASGSDGSGGGPSSPLLFFVALGFGVVFTNLWIIVGVKYCFRYNQRNRARMAGEDPDAVDLGQMPRQRRRREKKLMSIDEVNEKFPLVKYKTWRSSRADQGLPTAGGINSAPSRAASIRNEARDTNDAITVEKAQSSPTTSEATNEKAPQIHTEHAQPEIVRLDTIEASTSHQPVPANVIKTPEPALVKTSTTDDAEDPVDQIATAIPPENLPDPGDACAICIDTIEDDDDIRGLTCGHAFHASCVDPWLTSRRACCPLCKADYYTPKPRPEGETGEQRQMPSTPFAILTSTHPGRRGRARIIIPGVFFSHHPASTSRGRQGRRPVSVAPSRVSQTPVAQPDTQPAAWRQWISHPQMPALSRIRRARGTDSGSQPQESGVTPAQLEAGAR